MFVVVAEHGRTALADRAEFDSRGEAEDCFNRFMDFSYTEYTESVRLYGPISCMLIRGWTNPLVCDVYSEISNGEGCDAFSG